MNVLITDMWFCQCYTTGEIKLFPSQIRANEFYNDNKDFGFGEPEQFVLKEDVKNVR